MLAQLDFIGSSLEKTYSQLDLFNNKRSPIFSNVDSFFLSISKEEIEIEKECWADILPQNDAERFQRWLFSFLSVHSTWQNNIKGYNLLKDWTDWFNNWDLLAAKLHEAQIGLHNNRAKYIKEFAIKYWKNPSFYAKQKNESWFVYRNRLMKEILGLGFAKTSFAIEMIYMFDANVACMDTHLYQAYRLNQTKDSKLGNLIEQHFVASSRLFNISPPIARAILWNKKQNKKDSRYWNDVFRTFSS